MSGMHGYVNNAYIQGMHTGTSMEDRQMDLAEREQWAKWKEEEEKRRAEERKQAQRVQALYGMANSFNFDLGGMGQQERPDIDLYSNEGQRIGGTFKGIKDSLLG